MPHKEDQAQTPYSNDLLDVLIIGAGPCGLAVAARINESTPSALFTDEEHHRYHWIRRHGQKVALAGKKKYKTGNHCCSSRLPPSPPPSEPDSDSEPPAEEKRGTGPKTLVLDSTSSTWMSKWHRAFEKLEIAHLRSPMFFHVDPGDRDGMLAYTQETGRERELGELHGCVGKEISKHKQKKRRGQTRNRGAIGDREVEIDERDRKDYFTPSSRLFADYCDSIVRRYGLDLPGLVQKKEVVDLEYGELGSAEGEKVFTVRASDGDVFYARAVVLAVGPGISKIYPFPLSDEERAAACHSSEIGCFPSPRVQRLIQQRRETNVVVIGGGLTSAQLVDLAVKRGVSRVWYIMRSDLKVKHFDISLNWMGKFKNYEKAVFWSADSDDERMKMIQTARNGGSVTPQYLKILKQHVAHRRVSIHPRTVICERTYCPDSQTWRLTTDPQIPDLPPIDYIYFGTGMKSDVNELPMLQRMIRDHPIETKQGLPCITDDLTWQPNLPLFVTGRLAALRLGPGGANLEGARMGAERIAWGLEEMLKNDDETVQAELACFCGLENRYSQLDVS